MNNVTQKFVPYKGVPVVWTNAINLESFSPQEQKDIKMFITDYLSDNPLNFKDEYEKIKIYQANKGNTISDHWRHWGSNKNEIELTIDFDQCSTLGNVLNRCRDVSVQVTNPAEQEFAAALMCCDHPYQTAEFLLRRYAEEYALSFEDYMQLGKKMNEFIYLMMEICFYAKHRYEILRPAHYEKYVLGFDYNQVSVSKIPHPNHSSWWGGHPTVSNAAVAFLELDAKKRGNTLSPAFKKAGKEGGLARVWCGIHWEADIIAAQDGVIHFTPLVANKIAA